VKGGYLFARSPSEVTVLEVVELLDGELSARDAADDEIWHKAIAALREVLARTTIAELAEGEAQAKGQSMYYI
jgi:DNA-binding IscR family transcriptional regulator